MIKKVYENNDILVTEYTDNKVREKICIAETCVLKTIAFKLDIVLPFDYLDSLIKKFHVKHPYSKGY